MPNQTLIEKFREWANPDHWTIELHECFDKEEEAYLVKGTHTLTWIPIGAFRVMKEFGFMAGDAEVKDGIIRVFFYRVSDLFKTK